MKPVLVEQDFVDAAKLLDCSVFAIKAVAKVEAPRGGFNPDGTPVTLFEGHKFYQFTSGEFAASHPTLCHKAYTRKNYGANWEAEQLRLQQAMALDRDAAIRSASWGKFQIMGFNHVMVGHPDVQGFVNAMYKGEREHLIAFTRFVIAAGLAPALRRQDWHRFASGYNGPGYAENCYHTKMAAAFDLYEGGVA